MLKKLARSLLKHLPDGSVVPVLSGPLKGYRWMLHSGVHTFGGEYMSRNLPELLSRWSNQG